MGRRQKTRSKLDQNGNIIKECASCLEFKTLDNFHKNQCGKFKVRPSCKKCRNWGQYQRQLEKQIEAGLDKGIVECEECECYFKKKHDSKRNLCIHCKKKKEGWK